ncbi:PilZ domain-containing protein [Bdellovibrionota bacterium FG-2]
MGQGSQKTETQTGSTEKQVIDFGEVRTKRLEEKRRKTERIFFKHLLNVYSVIGNGVIQPIEICDISEEGCSFQVPFNSNSPWPTTTDNVPLRLYFSQDTYLEVFVTIQNSRPAIENNARYMRYGCSVHQTTASYAAYQQFVKFLKLYAEQSHKDLGDATVFYL